MSNMRIFEAVAVRVITPKQGADIMMAIDAARPWRAFLCRVVGHDTAVEMLPDETTKQRTWMCPRCGTYHSVVGGHYPPDWRWNKNKVG